MMTSMQAAASLALDDELVASCLLPNSPADVLFARAFRDTLASLSVAERRGALAGVTGHIAESVAELLFDGWGYSMLWHFEGPGRHGIDLLVLDPLGERVLAVEVKGTLRPRHWPRLSRRALRQMSAEWVDKRDNPGMSNWGLRSEDVYGAVVLVNFADRLYRVGVTADFVTLVPITDVSQLTDLSWLLSPGARG